MRPRDVVMASLANAQSLPVSDDPDLWKRIPRLALDHGLSPRLNGQLAATSVPLEIRNTVRDQAMGALAVQLQTEADLRHVTRVLDAVDVAWVAVKGPVLSEHWYAQSGQRVYVDLDLVVEPADFARALDALIEAHAQLVDRNFSHALRQRRAELSLLLPHGTALDLHWHVLNTPEQRAQFPFLIQEWLFRRERVRIGGLQVPTFDAEDTLLHLCLHTVLSGGRKLSWYRDLHAVSASGRIDWPTFVDRSQVAGAGLVAAVALDRARRWTEAPVPPQVLSSLTRGGFLWSTFLRLLDVLHPPGSPLESRLSGQLVWRSTRRSTRASLQALGRALTADLLAPLLHDPEHPWRQLRRVQRSQRRPNPLHQPPDDLYDRSRYLRYVTDQGARPTGSGEAHGGG